MKEIFTEIFNQDLWGHGKVGQSGDGSTLAYTEKLRAQLPGMFERYGVKTLLDAPCGDMMWMSEVLKGCSISYVGGDIVEPLIAKLKTQYELYEFLVLDITKDPLPEADMFFCRDCLFHFPQSAVWDTLDNFLRSNIPYLCTSTHLDATIDYHGVPFKRNSNIQTGDFALLNLFAFPYKFLRPLYRMDDTFYGHPKREMCVWSRDQIAIVRRDFDLR